MSDIKIVYRNVSELKPYSKNSRLHPEKQIKALMEGISKFGFKSVVFIDENNLILAGHGRVEAAKRLCLEKVPCSVIAGLSEAEKKAFNISDNQITSLSYWDEETLKSELCDIADDGLLLENLGFEDKFLSKLFDDTKGIQILDEIEEKSEGEIKVTFPSAKRIDVMNAISAATNDIAGVEIWCDE